MNLRIPRAYQAKSFENFDGTFTVYLESQAIASFQGKSQAHTFAKYLNAALRRLGPSSSVGLTEFPAAISQFISDASNSGNNFLPTLVIAS